MKYFFIIICLLPCACNKSNSSITMILWKGFKHDKFSVYNQKKNSVIDTILTTNESIGLASVILIPKSQKDCDTLERV